ncbi:MAG: hypothetical protein GF387_00215 [Candidatus Portnoybacteria bacterium]|nr:hypothetical protein [Candidatus Portnoybacteria bacterium]
MNLIPLKQKKRIRLLMLYQNVVSSGLLFVFLILFLVIILGGFLIFLNFKYQEIERNIVLEQSQVIKDETVKGIERKIEGLNNNLRKIAEIQEEQSHVYEMLDNLSRNLFIDIRVDSLQVDSSSGKISVSGFAEERDSLLRIKETLENDKEYSDIDFPISNITNPRNIDFHFSFTYDY